MSSLYYRHSGKLSPNAIGLLVAGLLLAALLGAIYGIAVYYIPLVFLNVLLTLGLGYALAWGVTRIAELGHVRSSVLVVLGAVMLAAVAEYAAFVSWVAVVTGGQAIVLLPHHLVQVVAYIAEIGVWGLRGDTPISGPALYAVWLVEAGIIIGIAAYVPLRNIRQAVYCERCAAWVDDVTVLPPFRAAPDVKAMRGQLESGDFSALGSLEALPEDVEATTFLHFTLLRCAGCNELHLMTIQNVTVMGVNENGEAQLKFDPVVRNLLIDDESRELILQIIEQRQPAAASVGDPEAAEEAKP